MKIESKFLSALAFMLVLILIGFCFFIYSKEHAKNSIWPNIMSSGYMEVDHDRPLHVQTRSVDVGGWNFLIPKAYLDSSLSSEFKHDAILLRVVWGRMISEYEALTNEHREEFSDQHIGNLLIKDATIMPSLDKSLDSILMGYVEKQNLGYEFELEKFALFRNAPAGKNLKENLYVFRDKDGSVTDFIFCDLDDSVPFPGCDHSFYHDGLRYNIHYNKDIFLPRWATLKLDSINLIDSFKTIAEGEK